METLKIKTCANSVCNASFKIKNPKKRFCSLHCKNQAAYNYRLKVYPWEVQLQKGRNKNIQILEYLWKNKTTRIQEEELRKMGFDFRAGYMYITYYKGFKIHRYGNICVQLLTETEVKLFEFEND